MENTPTVTSLTREELHQRVWSTPMSKLAREFEMSDVGLAKICKKHNIPRPSRGYWAKIENGKDVTRLPLRRLDDESLSAIRIRHGGKPMETPQILTASDPAIAALILAEGLPENRIEVVASLRDADPLVTAPREALAKQEPDEYGRVSPRRDLAGSCFDATASKAERLPSTLVN